MKTNIHFFILLSIACVAIINDLLIYLFKLQYGISIIISIILVTILGIFLLKKKYFTLKTNFNKADVFLFLILLFIILCTQFGIGYADSFYDTLSYHLYLQENPFIDKINFDFFPGRIYCLFLFALGDRMFYIFRYFFGYRFGTILSFYLPIILFYQVKRLLTILGNNKLKSSIFSYFILLVYTYSISIGNYYIDNLTVSFLLEAIIILFSNENIIKQKSILYTLTLILGISVGIKITSIFFVIPLVVYLIIKERKNLKSLNIKNIFLLGIIFTLPFAVYMIDNYIQTKSIIFPYYNKFLKSEYFEKENWVDNRFGINGILRKILWPIVVNYLYQYGDESGLHDFSWVIGYIFLIFFIIKNLKNRKSQQFHLAIISIIYTLVWVLFLKGYMRYGIIIPVLYIILLLDYLMKKIFKESSKIVKYYKIIFNSKKLINFLYFFCICCFIFTEIVLAPIYDSDNMNYNAFKYLFKDIERNCDKIHIDGVWGTTKDYSGLITLIREPNTPMYSLNREFFEKNPKTLKMWEERILNNDIYVIIDSSSQDVELEKLEEENFEIEKIVETYTSDDISYVNIDSLWYLVKVKYIGKRMIDE